MDIDYPTLFLDGFAHGVGLLVTGFGTAFAANPWPFIGAALLAVSAAIPTSQARRRRRA